MVGTVGVVVHAGLPPALVVEVVVVVVDTGSCVVGSGEGALGVEIAGAVGT
jgi:hypothetical protein